MKGNPAVLNALRVRECREEVFDSWSEDGVHVYTDVCAYALNPDGTCPNAHQHYPV